MRAFCVDLKKISLARTILCAAAVTLLCFFSHLETGGFENPPTLLELTVKAFCGENKRGFTALEIISAYDYSFWFYIVLPVILSMPSVSDFAEEWFGGGFFTNVSRQQIFKYCAAKSAAYALNAAAVFLAGFGVFAAVVCCAFPIESAELANSYNSLPAIAMRILNVTATGALCPIITILILIVIKEKFLALSFPMLVNYATSLLGGFLVARAYNEEKPLLRKFAYLLPSYQFSQSTGFKSTFGMPLFVWYIAWAAAFALCVICFVFLVKRRVKNAG